ncbi:sex peptide receptor-related protein 2 isoform X2 [Neocloeon triangulifer]|uniref:sex peptide receptor-related protein 2 isoform X2 n=1 Tax=Neocloeon triangulifer TaxID=2078957 RepID=UPI00286F02BF|nr:sex peptide receptor-related protein 2 isoform X2 [Neocloeon triangulifer]
MNDTATLQDAAPTSVYLDFMEGSRFWIQRVLVPIVVFVGVVGNIVTAIVLTRRRMRSSTNVYLTALAASDLLYLLFLFSLSLAHYGLTGATADAYWTYWRFGLWLTDSTSSTSIWLTVSFTVERYIAVCHPMRGKMLCTESRARKVTMLVYVLCFLSTFSTPFEWQTVRKPIEEINDTQSNVTISDVATRVTVELTELGKLHSYRTIFYWFSSLVFVFLPLLLLVVFNSFLILAVHKSQRQRRHLTQSERHRPDGSQNNAQQENKITVTLIAVVVLFLICQSPTAVTLIYTSLTDDPEPNSDKDRLLRGLGNIFNLLVAVNAACNFLLYCALSDKYRRTFAMTFLPRRCWARRDLRTNTVLGATSCVESPRRFSRSASLYRDPPSPAKTEYLQVPLNGSRTGAGAGLRRHQSAYIPRDRQTSSSPGSAQESSSIFGSANRTSLFSGSRSDCKLNSPPDLAESSGLLFELKNPSGAGTHSNLLCWKLSKRTKKDDLMSQELKITVSDTEVDGLSSV